MGESHKIKYGLPFVWMWLWWWWWEKGARVVLTEGTMWHNEASYTKCAFPPIDFAQNVYLNSNNRHKIPLNVEFEVEMEQTTTTSGKQQKQQQQRRSFLPSKQITLVLFHRNDRANKQTISRTQQYTFRLYTNLERHEYSYATHWKQRSSEQIRFCMPFDGVSVCAGCAPAKLMLKHF